MAMRIDSIRKSGLIDAFGVPFCTLNRWAGEAEILMNLERYCQQSARQADDGFLMGWAGQRGASCGNRGTLTSVYQNARGPLMWLSDAVSFEPVQQQGHPQTTRGTEIPTINPECIGNPESFSATTIPNQPDGIIADRCNGESFHGLLESQLQLAAPIHGLQRHLVWDSSAKSTRARISSLARGNSWGRSSRLSRVASQKVLRRGQSPLQKLPNGHQPC